MTAPGPIITSRDIVVLTDLYKYKYLSVPQIQRLHFPSLQTTYRRLRAMVKLGYLKNFSIADIPESVYFLTLSGAELVASNLGVATKELNLNRISRTPKDHYFLQHFIKINDFRIALSLACQKEDSPIKLAGFIPEHYGQQQVSTGAAKYIKDTICDINDASQNLSHTPDGVFAVRREQGAALFFLETDNGTETVSNEQKGVLKAIKFYFSYLSTEKYQRYQEDFNCSPFKAFRVLFVTTSASRVANIRQAISQLLVAEKSRRYIWLTQQSSITDKTILEPIWVSGDVTDGDAYSLAIGKVTKTT